MRGDISSFSYISVYQKPAILFKPSGNPKSTFISNQNLRKSGYLLLVIAVCTSLSVFLLGFSPPVPCTFDHQRLQTETGREFNNVELSSSLHNVSYSQEFWKQPDDLGFRPCLNFSDGYRRASNGGTEKRRTFLMVVVSGGLNQQRNQIIDAVVIARILNTSLVLPVLQVNRVWGDESEFSDIFDDQHFKQTLKDDVHIVSTLPPTTTYIGRTRRRRRRSISSSIKQLHVNEDWIRKQFMGRLNKHGALILSGLDSKLSKDLGPDLQKLRCKVAFHALKFRAWIEEIGEKLAKRMGEGGPYMALHLRLEKDVWLRTGCLPGLGEEVDRLVQSDRLAHPELLTSRINMTARDRYVAGLCPLNAIEVTRLLKALGASNGTRIYMAGGEALGGDKALEPLRSQFPHLYNKWVLAAAEGELDLVKLKHRPSVLAAIDYVVCLNSQVFMANHGGNMARALQGHRAYLGHMKHITPNKKKLVQLLMNKNLTETEMVERIKEIHVLSLWGSPSAGTKTSGRDVIAYPISHCMCTGPEPSLFTRSLQ
ncbi:PREDICTED: uncharacterized protein At1g04910-like [Nelumbo nucifera]|nr:PREDICTED: uncharacterized protein At1g04910-like [Nelumbo nucifera]